MMDSIDAIQCGAVPVYQRQSVRHYIKWAVMGLGVPF